MTMQPDLDRTLATWLEAERPALAPDGLLDEVLGEVAQTTRRPGWQVLDRWTWTATATRVWAASRAVALVGIVVLLHRRARRGRPAGRGAAPCASVRVHSGRLHRI